MNIVKHFKVSALPPVGAPDAYYLVEDAASENVELYVTTRTGEFRRAGNTEMIIELIDSRILAYGGRAFSDFTVPSELVERTAFTGLEDADELMQLLATILKRGGATIV